MRDTTRHQWEYEGSPVFGTVKDLRRHIRKCINDSVQQTVTRHGLVTLFNEDGSRSLLSVSVRITVRLSE